jgi:hypothetical protein
MKDAFETIAAEGAACRLYRDAPAWEGRKTAAVGAVRFQSAAAGTTMLIDVAHRLASEGFEALIGPMDGDTWHSYRLVMESDGSPPFLLEPVSGPHDLAAFTDAGFAPISRYVSSRTTLAEAISETRPTMDDIVITPWDGQGAERLVTELYRLSAGAFARNAFFKPIALEDFLALYRPIMPHVDPRLVLFAHAMNGDLAGFLFGYPDRLEGASAKTVILKTYASLRRGVGHLLADHFHRAARDLGFSNVIHALMHLDNASLRRSGQHGAAIFRRYALMGRMIAPS